MLKLVVLFSVLALAAAKPSVLAYSLPLAYNSYYPAVSSQSQYSVHGSALVPSYYGASYGLTYPSVVSSGYRFLAQPAHSPAVVLDPVNGVPLDTPEVVAARAAHFQAKALSGHHLAKRSLAPLTYSSAVLPSYSYGLSPYSSLAYSSPLVSAYSGYSGYSPYYASYSPYASTGLKALSVHPY